jgi:hypothetical protein
MKSTLRLLSINAGFAFGVSPVESSGLTLSGVGSAERVKYFYLLRNSTVPLSPLSPHL